MAEAKKKREAEQARRNEAARKKAAREWDAASPAPQDHPYLQTKGVQSYGLKVNQTGQLIVPACDNDKVIWTLQTISQDGAKRFLSGGAKRGNYFTIPGNDKFYICEGYATGASIHESTGGTVIVAFDSGNLKPVAKNIKAKYANHQIVICGDNDQWTKDNPGAKAAREAAAAIGARIVAPKFKDTTERPTDFNDLARLESPQVVKAQIEATRAVLAIDDDGPMHLNLARTVINNRFGIENILHSSGHFWTWNNSGVWRKVDDREIKQAIHQEAGGYKKLTRNVVASILDMIGTEAYKPRHEFDIFRGSINCLNGEREHYQFVNEKILRK